MDDRKKRVSRGSLGVDVAAAQTTALSRLRQLARPTAWTWAGFNREAGDGWWRARTTTSENRRIFAALLSGGAATLVATVFVGARDLLMANTYGVSRSVDAYVLATTLVMFLISVITSSAGPALMPSYVRSMMAEDSGAARAVARRSGLAISGLLLAVAISIVFASRLLFGLISGTFSVTERDLGQRLVLWMAPMFLAQGWVAILTVVAQARRRFSRPALATALPALGGIVGLLILDDAYGIASIAMGTMFGALLQLAMFVPEWRWLFQAQPGTVPPQVWCRVLRQYWPMLAGAVVWGISPLVNQGMAAMLEPGSIAVLSYGQKAVSFIVGIAALALGNAVLPEFSGQVARRDFGAARYTLRTYRQWVLIVSVPVVLAGMVLSESVVAVVFERGAFGPRDTALVARTQAAFLLQVPFYLVSILCVRLLSALDRNRILLLGALGSLTVNACLNYVFMQYLGVAGIALATSAVYAISYVFLEVSVRRALKNASWSVEQPHG